MLAQTSRQFGQLLISTLACMIILQGSHIIFFFDLSFGNQVLSLYSTLIFLLRCSILIALIVIPLGLVNLTVSKWVGVCLFCTILISHFLLLSYLMTTGIPLGADLFGYSISDIRKTVSASASVNFYSLALFILSVCLLIIGSTHLTQWANKHFQWISIIGVLAWFIPHPDSSSFDEATYNLVHSPSSYFWNRSSDYFFGSTQLDEEIATYPFLQARNKSNPLANYLTGKNDLPNIVFIALEGMGADFVGSKAPYGGATPFLDSLITQSLYWPNCLSNTGRTFGVLPTLTGSLPYGQTGFMGVAPNFPNHISLWSWLNSNGYETMYFYGGNGNFDNQDVFLEAQGIDHLFDESSFPPGMNKMPADDNNFSWGYGDKELFEHGIKKLSEATSPKFSFFMTLTDHEPFIPPTTAFTTQIDDLIAAKHKSTYNEYGQIFECLAYTDHSLREFIKACQKTDDYRNTIFVITGDHRLIPVPAEKRLDRFHVPLLIFSPLVSHPTVFEGLVAHSQITPTLMNWLSDTYQLSVNEQVSFISDPFDTNTSFGSNLDVALMRSKNEIEEYIMGTKVLSDGKLYEIDAEFSLTPVSNKELKQTLISRLNAFKVKGDLALRENRLIPDSLSLGLKSTYILSEKDLTFLEEQNLINSAPDTLYYAARNLAINRSFPQSRIIIKYGLSKSPNFHDLRVLLARTYAWNSQFDSAKIHLDETLRRAENYEDAYIAYADVAYWNEKTDLALEMASTGLERNPTSLELKTRLARSYLEKNKTLEASKIVNDVLAIDPSNEMANTLQKRLRNL